MRLYVRLLKPDLRYTGEEENALVQIVESGPGVERVGPVERHAKGGYAAMLDVARESLDPFVEHLARHGLQSVL
jgi:hypothetical protein